MTKLIVIFPNFEKVLNFSKSDYQFRKYYDRMTKLYYLFIRKICNVLRRICSHRDFYATITN
jgi:hypothetical protein